MARANLLVSEALADFFLDALKPESGTAWMQAKLDDDVSIVLKEHGSENSDSEAVFVSVQSVLEELDPSFIIFCLDPTLPTKKWVLVSYVPDGCPVRARMLYATAGQDIKQRLGHSNFKADIHITNKDEFTRTKIFRDTAKDNGNLPLSEAERTLKEERVASYSTKKSAMGVVPFQLDDALKSALAAFAAQEWNLLEIKVQDDESVVTGELKSTSASDLTPSNVQISDPRFYIVRLGKTGQVARDSTKIFFIYSCPEAAKVRQRMLYSAAKASVVSSLESLKITVEKFSELSEPNTIGSLLATLVTVAEGTEIKSNDSTTQRKSFARPRRPGRGRARMIRKP